MVKWGANPTEKSKKFRGTLLLAAARGWDRLKQALIILKRPFLWLKERPRYVKVILVYAVVMVMAGAFFFWWASRFRLANPYTTEPRFDWEEYKPGEKEEDPEPVSRPDPEEKAPEQEPVSEEQPGPAKGVWPLEGELLYRFHEHVTYPLPVGQYSFYLKGIAIQAGPGTAVKAVWDGKVTRVREMDFPRGVSVTVLHDDGKVTLYGGLEQPAVRKDDLLKQGDTVGVVAPGMDNEPAYLYLEVHADGRPVDPLNYLP